MLLERPRPATIPTLHAHLPMHRMGRHDRGAHQQGPFAGVREPDNAGLEVWGVPLAPMVDEDAWKAQNNASLLLEWAGELVERWDAR